MTDDDTPTDAPGDDCPDHGPYGDDDCPKCIVCDEADPSVILDCRDGIVRCAQHANDAGYCWGCGEADPQWYADDDTSDGLCHDCRSADVMFERKRRRRRIGIR